MAENRLTYLLVLIEEANYLKTQTEQTGSGHIFTTIRTLEHRIKEIRKELEQKNEVAA